MLVYLEISKLIAEQYNLKKRVLKRVLSYSAMWRRAVKIFSITGVKDLMQPPLILLRILCQLICDQI